MMTGLGAARSALRARIEATWTATPLVWPRATFEMPAPAETVVRVEIVGSAGNSSMFGSVGKRLAGHDGFVAGQVFAPITSDNDPYLLAEAFGEILRVQRIGPVQTGAPSVGGGDIGSDDGNWYRVDVIVPWWTYFAA